MKRWPAQLVKSLLGFVALAFCAAPVPGDVGGCGQEAQDLDPIEFFSRKQNIECAHCQECEIVSEACLRACGDVLVQFEFPESCAPLVHDGEVCLRALGDGSCDDYREYMSDTAPSVPTECNFCPVREGP
ncbi:MAG TPA: hypothetical protein VJN18_30065 [Polyangiaceae bacterium]|nr:hypothetical protein [Polyangiaceae bacterium]